MRCLYRERRYYCGDYLEVDIFPVYAAQRGRGRRAKPTSETQARLNEHNSEEKLIRLLNANFTAEDVELHLTYRDENLPQNPEDARRDVQNFLRRIKRMRTRLGIAPLKYVAVTEGGGDKRYHHHITLNGGVDRDVLESAWGLGYANSRRLQFCETGVEGLARYITKQWRDEKESAVWKKRYICSKNLVQPVPRDRDGKVSAKRVQELATYERESLAAFTEMYPGYTCAEVRPFFNEVNRGFYLCVKLYRDDAAFNNTRQRRKRE